MVKTYPSRIFQDEFETQSDVLVEFFGFVRLCYVHPPYPLLLYTQSPTHPQLFTSHKSLLPMIVAATSPSSANVIYPRIRQISPLLFPFPTFFKPTLR